MYLVIKIELSDVDNPKIWRRIKVPEHYTFDQFHHVLQAAMGWKNSHLYRFMENDIYDTMAISSPYDEDYGINAQTVEVGNLLFQFHDTGFMDGKRKKLKYWYDYGDSWVHEIDVEEVIPEDIRRAEIIEGEGACPPEDCGGIPGFEDIKESLRTGEPSVIHHESWIPWLEGCGYKNYNPDVFDLAAAKRALRKAKL